MSGPQDAWRGPGWGRGGGLSFPLIFLSFLVRLGAHTFVATSPPPAFYQRERRREGERARGREGGGESPACFVLGAVGGNSAR